MQIKYDIGDVVLRPLPDEVEVDNITNYVMTVIQVTDTMVTGVNGSGIKCKEAIDSVKLVAAHLDIIIALMKQGGELCARAENGGLDNK